MDSEGSGNLLYLPLDQLLKQPARSVPQTDMTRSADTQAEAAERDAQFDTRASRERRVRQ